MNRRVNLTGLVFGMAFVIIALLAFATGTELLAVASAVSFAIPIALIVLGAVVLVLSRRS